jgi:hypothetical protein
MRKKAFILIFVVVFISLFGFSNVFGQSVQGSVSRTIIDFSSIQDQHSFNHYIGEFKKNPGNYEISGPFKEKAKTYFKDLPIEDQAFVMNNFYDRFYYLSKEQRSEILNSLEPEKRAELLEAIVRKTQRDIGGNDDSSIEFSIVGGGSNDLLIDDSNGIFLVSPNGGYIKLSNRSSNGDISGDGVFVSEKVKKIEYNSSSGFFTVEYKDGSKVSFDKGSLTKDGQLVAPSLNDKKPYSGKVVGEEKKLKLKLDGEDGSSKRSYKITYNENGEVDINVKSTGDKRDVALTMENGVGNLIEVSTKSYDGKDDSVGFNLRIGKEGEVFFNGNGEVSASRGGNFFFSSDFLTKDDEFVLLTGNFFGSGEEYPSLTDIAKEKIQERISQRSTDALTRYLTGKATDITESAVDGLLGLIDGEYTTSDSNDVLNAIAKETGRNINDIEIMLGGFKGQLDEISAYLGGKNRDLISGMLMRGELTGDGVPESLIALQRIFKEAATDYINAEDSIRRQMPGEGVRYLSVNVYKGMRAGDLPSIDVSSRIEGTVVFDASKMGAITLLDAMPVAGSNGAFHTITSKKPDGSYGSYVTVFNKGNQNFFASSKGGFKSDVDIGAISVGGDNAFRYQVSRSGGLHEFDSTTRKYLSQMFLSDMVTKRAHLTGLVSSSRVAGIPTSVLKYAGDSEEAFFEIQGPQAQTFSATRTGIFGRVRQARLITRIAQRKVSSESVATDALAGELHSQFLSGLNEQLKADPGLISQMGQSLDLINFIESVHGNSVPDMRESVRQTLENRFGMTPKESGQAYDLSMLLRNPDAVKNSFDEIAGMNAAISGGNTLRLSTSGQVSAGGITAQIDPFVARFMIESMREKNKPLVQTLTQQQLEQRKSSGGYNPGDEISTLLTKIATPTSRDALQTSFQAQQTTTSPPVVSTTVNRPSSPAQTCYRCGLLRRRVCCY